jgi:hypothetical protein
VAGIVGQSGNVVVGSGFAAARVSTGIYTIDFPAGTFGTLPVVVATPFGSNGDFRVVKVASVQDFSGLKRATVSVSSTVGAETPTNYGFSFVAVEG